eukprot:TRINITY_DN5992_c0_g1_i1.p1 TRINITY_DN5992_c0_g1~~TRINITY_DN5992_c0_g1_i1.p1  ORF type:complete len:291 (+),score=21.66 TRINITY_DN5992_c0_g1_i1:76-948(+)
MAPAAPIRGLWVVTVIGISVVIAGVLRALLEASQGTPHQLAGAGAAQAAPASERAQAAPASEPAASAAADPVVLMTHQLTGCSGRRLARMRATAGPDHPVLALHRGLPGAAAAPVVQEAALPAVKRLRSKVGAAAWARFGGPSRDRKQGFLAWLAASSYQHAWHVEHDAVWAGPWQALLGRYSESTADLIASLIPRNRSQGWVLWATCPECQRYPKHAVKTRWPVVRVSRRLAVALVQGLADGAADGHHEAVLATFCALHLGRCLMHDLGRDGVLAPGGSGQTPRTHAEC